ncbi:MAG: hypothetical protein JW742_06365 [Candidatus Aminicenantes bacterium]|nr:hypothetical protein [Candidatus Aminicenantes bacterium]
MDTTKGVGIFLIGLIVTASAVAGQPRAVKPFEDVRFKDLKALKWAVDPAVVRTLWFNEKTVWPDARASLARSVLRKAKNPGLKLRSLHARGLTGKGVTAAIIDQNMFLDHPEYAGKIIAYKDFGCGAAVATGSMHGPAVASLLVGKTIGAAPGARLYYAAVPSWLADARYYARAMDWMVAENAKLPAGSKIRVVSISAAPSGASSFYKNKKTYEAARARAEKARILVMDCTDERCFTNAAFYNINAPDDLSQCKLGFPKYPGPSGTENLYIPSTRRTQAEEYEKGACSYQYTGSGGLSWTVPTLAGVLALGWQVNPSLSGAEIIRRAKSSAYLKNGKYMIIDPEAFVAAAGE